MKWIVLKKASGGYEASIKQPEINPYAWGLIRSKAGVLPFNLRVVREINDDQHVYIEAVSDDRELN